MKCKVLTDLPGILRGAELEIIQEYGTQVCLKTKEDVIWVNKELVERFVKLDLPRQVLTYSDFYDANALYLFQLENQEINIIKYETIYFSQWATKGDNQGYPVYTDQLIQVPYIRIYYYKTA